MFFGASVLAQESRVRVLGGVACVACALQALADELCLNSLRVGGQKFQFGLSLLGHVRCGSIDKSGQLTGVAGDDLF